MRSRSGDFHVCIKPNRMVMCVPVFGKVVGSVHNPVGLVEGGQRKVEGRRQRQMTEKLPAPGHDQRTAFLQYGRNSSEKKNSLT